MHRAIALALLVAAPTLAQQPAVPDAPKKDAAPAAEAPKKAAASAPAAEAPKKDAAPVPAAEAPKKDAAPAPAAEAPKKDAAPAPAAEAPKKAPPPAAAAPEQPKVTMPIPPGVTVGHGSPAMMLQGAPSETDRVRGMAKLFFQSLLRADAHAAVELSALPFSLEGRRFESPDALLDEWVKHLRAKRTDLITLYGIDVYTPEQMEQKYGKPPARLSNLPLHTGAKTYVVVANLSGHAAVAIYREVNGIFRAMAYTD